MSTATLNHGALGRCSCGAVGRRRKHFNGEPICPKCLPMRTGPVLTLRDQVHHEFEVGKLTRAQRAARVARLSK